MVLIALTYFITNILSIYKLNKVTFLGIAFILLAIPLSSKHKKLIVIGSILSLLCFYSYQLRLPEFLGEDLVFQGVLLQNEQRFEEYSLAEMRINVQGSHYKTKVYFKNNSEPLRMSDKITGTGFAYIPKDKSGFSSTNYYKGQGIHFLISAEEITVTNRETGSILRNLDNLKQEIQQRLQKYLSIDAYGFMNALLLGDKQLISDDLQIDVNKIGISHILVVSGMHISFLSLLCLKIFGRRVGYICGIFIMVCFALMIGLSPSVIRAVIMQLILIIAWFSNETYSSKKAFAFALIVLLMLNPYIIYDVGFVLSFLSSGAIIFIYPWFASCIRVQNSKINQYLLSPVCLFFSVFMITIIPLFFYFGRISSMGMIANILVVPLIGILFPMGIIFIPMSFIGELPANILGSIIELIVSMAQWIIYSLAQFPYVTLPYTPTYLWIMLVVISMAFYTLWKRRVKITITLMLLSQLLTIAFSYSYEKNMEIHILSVGDGQSIIVDYNNTVIVIDVGSTGYYSAQEQLKEVLYTKGYSQIDHLIVTSVDKTHMRGLNDLHIPVTNLVYPKNPVNKNGQLLLETYLASYNGTINSELPEYIHIHENVDKKLAVCVDDIIILHAFTNDMIDLFLEDYECDATTVILADKVLYDYKSLEKQLDKLGVTQVILSNDYDQLQIVSGKKAKTTAEYGQIIITKEGKDG